MRPFARPGREYGSAVSAQSHPIISPECPEVSMLTKDKLDLQRIAAITSTCVRIAGTRCCTVCA